MKKLFAAFALATVLTLTQAIPALADTQDDYGPGSQDDTLSLSGSTVSPLCAADVPWIDFDVILTDPSHRATGHTAYLVLTDGSNTETITLGELVDDRVSGRVLWPGASVGTDGRGNGWPGWELQNGQWVQTPGNFAWTRGEISATIEVNPSVAVALSYPPSTPHCVTSPPGTRTTSGAVVAAAGLPATGGDAAGLAPIAWTAGGLIALGGAVVLIRRARRARG